MSNEENQSQLKDKLPDFGAMKEKASAFGLVIKKLGTIIGLFAMLIAGFVIGARMHELGALNGVVGKTLKGATVSISGPCLIDGEERYPALAEDEVKITSVEANEIVGVVRKTREVVVCDPAKVAIDTLPLLSNLSKVPSAIPELKQAERKEKTPSFKSLENKVLLVSGSCRSQVDGKELAPFTDEKIDVTRVEASKETKDEFVIAGIRRSDKLALSCSSRAIKYAITSGQDPITPEVKLPVSFVNKIITVSSKCMPDPRLPIPRGSDGRKVSFYRLTNSPVQVIEESLVDEKLVKFTGSIVDKKMKEAFGQMIVCDSSVFPMTYDLAKDSEDVKLDSVNSDKDQKVDNTQIVLDEAKKDEKKTEDQDSKNKKDLIKKLEGNQ